MDIGKDLQKAFKDGYRQAYKDLREIAKKKINWLRKRDKYDMVLVYEVIDTIDDIFEQ